MMFMDVMFVGIVDGNRITTNKKKGMAHYGQIAGTYGVNTAAYRPQDGKEKVQCGYE
jgi:hypothetical protein